MAGTVELGRVDAPRPGKLQDVVLGRMQDQLAAGIALAAAHAAQLEQGPAEPALLAGGAAPGAGLVVGLLIGRR